MFCEKCGATIPDNAVACGSCGEPIAVVQPAQPVPVQPVVPEENRPLSPWAYWGLQLLFAVPVVGFIFLIIFSIKRSNINRRNFARSYWCNLIIIAAVLAVRLSVGAAAGAGLEALFR